jgi:hypothetical protein
MGNRTQADYQAIVGDFSNINKVLADWSEGGRIRSHLKAPALTLEFNCTEALKTPEGRVYLRSLQRAVAEANLESLSSHSGNQILEDLAVRVKGYSDGLHMTSDMFLKSLNALAQQSDSLLLTNNSVPRKVIDATLDLLKAQDSAPHASNLNNGAYKPPAGITPSQA